MKYVWEFEDVASGMDVVEDEKTFWRIGHFNKAKHGADNGWYAISNDGDVVFFECVARVYEWMNTFNMKPLEF